MMGGCENICISSRVRIARNVKGLPFPDRMNARESEILIDKVKGALGNKYIYINFSSLPDEKKHAYAESHIVSKAFIDSKNKTALFMNEDKSVAVMVGEEDHIRIQAFSDGNNLKEAKKKAFEAENQIEKSVEFLFDSKYGYVTKCPTNMGTGVRASVMMYLGATVNQNSIASYSSELARMGMTIRGAFGESTEAIGDIYQISNSTTLGITEDEIIEKVDTVVSALTARELENEKRIFEASEVKVRDSAMRALGILRSAYMISNSEAQSLISKVRFGSNLGVVDVDGRKLNKAASDSFPDNLSVISGKQFKTAIERDIFRAEYLKKVFGD